MIPMRDGVRLAADIYRPAIEGIAAADKFPVILQRTPYNKQIVSSWAEYFVPHGYIVVSTRRARPLRIRGSLASASRRQQRRIRYSAVDRQAALV